MRVFEVEGAMCLFKAQRKVQQVWNIKGMCKGSWEGEEEGDGSPMGLE